MRIGATWQVRGKALTVEQKRWTLVGLSCGIFALVVATALGASLKSGRLSMPPQYDDVVYLYWSLKILRGLSELPLFSSLYQLLDQHSPLTSFFGVLGYDFFNGDIGPYIVSTVPLFVFGAILAALLRGLPLPAGIGIVCATFALPILPTFVTEFRPEPVWSVLVAICVISYFSIDSLWSSRGVQAAIGAATGLAVISKPTTSPFTVALLGSALLAAGMAKALESSKVGLKLPFRSILGAAVTVWIFALLIVLPVAVVIGQEIFNYVKWVLHDIADQVQYNGSLLEQALYYSFGPGGRQMFGSAMPIFLTIWIFGSAFAVLRCPEIIPRVSGLGFVLLMSYAIPSFSAVKMVWFGSAFYSLLLMETAYLIGILFAVSERTFVPKRVRFKSFLSGLIFVGGSILLVQAVVSERKNPFGMDAEARTEVTDRTNRIWDVLRNREIARVQATGSHNMSNVMTIAVEPIVGSVITLYGLKEGLPIQGVEFSYAKSTTELIKNLANMDYVVVSPSHQHLLSGAMLGDQLISVMNQSPEFLCVSQVPLSSGRFANIYERRLKPPA